jgi:DNA-binding NarL/FixJ family response regulator
MPYSVRPLGDTQGADSGQALVGVDPDGDAEAIAEPRTRVLVVDDHDLFRVGLASALEAYSDIEVLAQASTGRMGVRLAAELRPDVVLLDLRLPDLEGAAVTRAMLEDNEAARIVILTVIGEGSDIAAAVDAGACGYLFKDSPIDDVVAAIRAAASGNAWLAPRAAQALLDRIRREHARSGLPSAPAEDLSPREIEVLRLLARGCDNNQIAAELSMSPSTAKNHVSSILNKLGVSNRIQAAIYAVRMGMA